MPTSAIRTDYSNKEPKLIMTLPRPLILTLLVLSLGIAGCATPPAPLPPGMTDAIEDTWQAAPATDDDGRWHRALDQADLAKARHDTTADGYGTATGSVAGYANEGAGNAFDGTPAKYCLPEENFWVQYRYGGGLQHTVTSYAIQAANDAPGRDPKHWKLLGSNDGSNWTVVDQQSGVAFPERHFTRVFEVAKPGAYNLYRLDVQQNLGDSNSQIAELDLLVEKGQEAPVLDAALQQLLANREQGLAPLFAADFSDAIVNPGSWVFEEDGVLVPRGGGEKKDLPLARRSGYSLIYSYRSVAMSVAGMPWMRPYWWPTVKTAVFLVCILFHQPLKCQVKLLWQLKPSLKRVAGQPIFRANSRLKPEI